MRPISDPVETSIIVVSHNTKAILKSCIQSIYDHPPPATFEVIVVDNASGDGSSEMVQAFLPQVNLFRLPSNRGYAYACNYGASFSQGRMLLFLNSDIEVTPGALEVLHNCMRKREGGILCSGGLQSLNGSLQPSCRKFPTHLSILFSRGSVLSKLPVLGRFQDRYITRPPEGEAEVDSVAGACMLIRKETFWKLGGFDLRFFMYVEDLDLCYRLRKMGGVVLYVSEALFKHCWGASSKVERVRLELEHHRSIYRYFKKHYPGRAFLNLILAIMLLGQLGSLSFLNFLNLRRLRGKTPLSVQP